MHLDDGCRIHLKRIPLLSTISRLLFPTNLYSICLTINIFSQWNYYTVELYVQLAMPITVVLNIQYKLRFAICRYSKITWKYMKIFLICAESCIQLFAQFVLQYYDSRFIECGICVNNNNKHVCIYVCWAIIEQSEKSKNIMICIVVFVFTFLWTP